MDRGKKRDLRRGSVSTRKAPGSMHSTSWLNAASTRFTRGSSCSLTEYPWDIIKMMVPAVLSVYTSDDLQMDEVRLAKN